MRLELPEIGYSMTSSARASSFGGISRPSTLAVRRLITNSNLVGLDYWHVGRLLALEHSTEYAELSSRLGDVTSVAHQATSHDGHSKREGGGKRIAQRHRGDLFASAGQVRIGVDKDRSGLLPNYFRECRVNLTFGANSEHDNLSPKLSRRTLRRIQVGLCICI